MKCWPSFLLGIVLSTTAAHAQVGIYGKFDAARFTAANIDGVNPTTTWFYGPGVGIYYDFLHLGPISLGADLRGNLLRGSQQKYRSALFGLRLAAKPPLLPIRPYVQGSVGVGGSRQNVAPVPGDTNYSYSDKFQYQVLGGLDYTIFPHLDLRLVEVGYGRMSGISSFKPAPVSTVTTLSSGLVVRFP